MPGEEAEVPEALMQGACGWAFEQGRREEALVNQLQRLVRVVFLVAGEPHLDLLACGDEVAAEAYRIRRGIR